MACVQVTPTPTGSRVPARPAGPARAAAGACDVAPGNWGYDRRFYCLNDKRHRQPAHPGRRHRRR